MTLETIEATLTTAEDVLRWGRDTYYPNIAFASSFGAEDVVVIDLLARLQPAPRIFTLDTGRLHAETYEVMERIRERYGVTLETYFPDTARTETLVRDKGFYSFRSSIADRKECCGIRKVEPLKRALSGLKAWITGLRREQAVTRTGVRKIEVDAAFGGIIKLNPLADWTQDQVWEYIKANQVPYNRLHDSGFPSIGCEPCTRAIKPGEDLRAGRWWWELPEHKECGLHTKEPGHVFKT
jgi:phosphoadenosine phosphosulfate reductase